MLLLGIIPECGINTTRFSDWFSDFIFSSKVHNALFSSSVFLLKLDGSRFFGGNEQNAVSPN